MCVIVCAYILHPEKMKYQKTFSWQVFKFKLIFPLLPLPPTPGQFWNIPIQVEPYTGLLRNGSAVPDGYYTITVNHPNEVRSFTGWLYSLTWEYREEYCLYAGNQQAGPIYEIETPNDPVIEGGYSEYQVTSSNETDFEFSQFDESLCGN